MLSRWPIRYKLLVCIGLLLVILLTLAFSGFQGGYAYRGLAKSISRRAMELPLATALAQRVSDLRATLSRAHSLHDFSNRNGQPPVDAPFLRDEFRENLVAVKGTLQLYRKQLASHEGVDERISDTTGELDTVDKIERRLSRISQLHRDEDWMLNEVNVNDLVEELDELHRLSGELPSFLQQRMHDFAGQVRAQYRTWIVLIWVTIVAALLLLVLLVLLIYAWVFQPLRQLIQGSRRVAGGDFSHRIRLETRDEMSELAEAMNEMTAQFQSIRDDLDRQVQQRTKQVVRSEQLASVGFLAAGVAHEINNPLASIALSAESLEGRVGELLDDQNEDHRVIYKYLRMIQQEAFRCKSITEKLLDFSRMGDVERHPTDLRQLVEDVIDMVQHLGRFKDKHIELVPGPSVQVCVNAQEIKQVVLNLVTNGLDSCDSGGTVTLGVACNAGNAELTVTDDGCGMSDEVLKQLYEPFFTRRRNGQGTGLGLSITYRIVADHEGHIEAHSEGMGKGSQFVVLLPLADSKKEMKHRYQAA